MNEGLSHCRQARNLKMRWQVLPATATSVLALKSALGSHPCVALSSAQAESIVVDSKRQNKEPRNACKPCQLNFGGRPSPFAHSVLERQAQLRGVPIFGAESNLP
jgi:hypothetical protein